MVSVREASGHTLRGVAVARTTLIEHATVCGDRDRATAAIAAAAATARNGGTATESVGSTGNEHAFV